MKKAIAIVMAAMIIPITLAACSSKETVPTELTGEETSKGFVELTENLGAEEYGIGFRNGDIALGLEIQKNLDDMIADGTSAQISKKWFGKDVLMKDGEFLEEKEAPAEDKSLEDLKEKGKFIVGLDDSYPPMGFRDENNKVVGFDIDLATEVAKRMGVEIVFQPIDWDSKELELNSGKIDCIWNGMTITPERIESMFFTKSYIANEQIIIVPADSLIEKKADLEGKIIGLQKGSSSLDALNGDPICEKVKEVVEYPDNVAAYMDLKTGRIEVFVVDSVVGRYVLAQDEK